MMNRQIPFWMLTRCLWLAVVVFWAGCALQEDLLILDRRVSALHRQVTEQESRLDDLESQVTAQENTQTETGTSLRNKQADLGLLLNRIRNELTELRGRLEENEYRTSRQTGAWESAEADMSDRLETVGSALESSLDRIVRLEAYLGMEPSERLEKTTGSDDASGRETTESQETADTLYIRAKEQFDNGKYETARNLFERFLKAHGQSEKADNAQFWLGEIYYREKWYEKAILEYQKVIETYPKGNKVRSALLKQGLAFLNLGDEDNARLILKELVRKHPDSSEAKIAAERLERF